MFETFWIEPTDREYRFLRRYAEGECPAMGGDHSYHRAHIQIEDGPAGLRADDNGHMLHFSPDPGDAQFCRDERWRQVAICACGYQFTTEDKFQILTHLIYRRIDGAGETSLGDAPTGALWSAWWMGDWAKGDDGLAVVCRLPGGHDWLIDGSASNCTREGQPHHCWVRHGTFGERLTVDKNGDTCAAGGGSIWVHKPVEWHGFLRQGRLVEVGEA